LQSSLYGRVWRKARARALTPVQVASPLAKRPYDLRHACASLWLAGGVAVTDVAERLGHSVETLLKVYAACIDGNSDRNNVLIAAALEASADTATEGTTISPVTSENASAAADKRPEAA
jgi:integrase